MKPLVSRWIRMRLALVAALYLAGLALVLARAFQLQVLDRSRLARLAERQHSTEIQVTPRRGPIYDRQMQELAVSLQVDSVYIRPGEIEARKIAASRLAAALGVNERSLLAKIEGKSPFVWVKRYVTPSEARVVAALNMPGVGFLKEGRRYYPHRTLAAKLLGFVGMDGEGLEGLERRFDNVLRGQTETVVATRDAAGRSILDRGASPGERENGRGIVLTIDEAIQYIAETELTAAVQRARAKRGIAIVMDPHTGDILALAESPGFNPNVYGAAPPEHRKCLAFSTTFEPGSTFKIFVVAAAIEEDAVRPSDRFYCENGSYGFAGRTIHDVHPYGWLDVADIVKHSSNIGALKIADRLGQNRLYRYVRGFGFGAPSGADFPSDLPGLLPPLRRWSRITQGTVAFGQGIAITPIQLAAALGAIANGGVLMRPRLVTAEVSPEGPVLRRFDPVAVRRVISEETARTITRLMKRVTEKGGTGEAARTTGYAVAGKTGTAQKVKEGVRGYSSKRIGSFIGFAPADDPRIVVAVIIDEPTGVAYGGTVAAPAFRGIVEKTLTYLDVPPEIPVTDAPSKKTPTLEVKKPPRSQTPQEARGGPAPAVTPVALQTGIPDFSGLSMREALALAGSRNLEIVPEGSGVAVSQDPPPGISVTPGQVLRVRFSLPGSS